MPRENSFSDSDGRSLTPDLEEEREGVPEPISPTYQTPPHSFPPPTISTTLPKNAQNLSSPSKRSDYRNTPVSPTPHRPPLPGMTHLTPRDKFRSVARKVIAMHRSTNVISSRTGVGAEPGVDPRRASADLQYGHIRQDCVIEMFDYSGVRCKTTKMDNEEFVKLMSNETGEREPWVKVRWINIGGVSWDVIKAVSIKYDLHPLALEDIFHARKATRSKADYFSTQLFLRVLCHELGDPEDPFVDISNIPNPALGGADIKFPRSSSPLPFTKDDKDGYEMGGREEEEDQTVYGSVRSKGNTMNTRKKSAAQRRPILPMSGYPSAASGSSPPPPYKRTPSSLSKLERQIDDPREKRRLEEVALDSIKKQDDRVSVKVYPVHIFLLRDGTVISITTSLSKGIQPENELTKPIVGRINQRDSMLRTSADPSLLVQSLLDLMVDKALEVVDEYHAKIKKFEREVLIKPSVKTIRNLHILTGDLTLHKRTLEPLKTLLYGLRRYDLDRCAAVIDTSKNPNMQVVGFMSHKSKIYLADVYDHMDYILTSIDMFMGVGDGLVDYTFNMKSYEMNETMRLLTMVTIIFLPLTLLTGYFGMNFFEMWSVNNNSDLLFWIIALPVMAIVVPIATFGDLKKAYHYFQKKVIAKNAVKTYQVRRK